LWAQYNLRKVRAEGEGYVGGRGRREGVGGEWKGCPQHLPLLWVDHGLVSMRRLFLPT
jgi:hypothetical protein